MARNRHPERTRARILDVAKRLFFTKGYDGTTMQDIVDSLGDLSKGAVYYHFKSKEAILDALGEEDQSRHDPMAIDDTGLTGLDKLREAFRRSAADNEHMRLMNAAYPAMHDPKLLAANLKVWRTQVADMFDAMIREGVADGSIDTAYPREAAELLALLTNYWLAPRSIRLRPTNCITASRRWPRCAPGWACRSSTRISSKPSPVDTQP